MYATAHFVADILSPLVGKTQHRLHNRIDLVKKLTPFRLDEGESIISLTSVPNSPVYWWMRVSPWFSSYSRLIPHYRNSLAQFTSVLVKESLILIQELLEADSSLSELTWLSPQQVTDLLKMCLTTTYFMYDGDYYTQIEVAAMGSPVSPIVCNLFMEWFEVKSFDSYSDPLWFSGRYVNDGVAVIKTSATESFTSHLNSQQKNIKWTSELESNHTLVMLDTLITRKTTNQWNIR